VFSSGSCDIDTVIKKSEIQRYLISEIYCKTKHYMY
jgi:hypothetical protein